MIITSAREYIGTDGATVSRFLTNPPACFDILPFVETARPLGPSKAICHLTLEVTNLIRDRTVGVTIQLSQKGKIFWRGVGTRVAIDQEWGIKSVGENEVEIHLTVTWRMADTLRPFAEPALQHLANGYPKAILDNLAAQFWQSFPEK